MKKFFFFLAFISSLLALDASAKTTFSRTQVLMGDVPVSITIRSSPREKQKAFLAMEKAFAEVARVTELVSEWSPKSETTRLNQNAGKEWVEIGRDLVTILGTAQKVSEATDGAFDITFASPCHRKKTNTDCSYRAVKMSSDGHKAYLPRGIKIGVSGIAKGYIVDRMSDLLKMEGFRDFLINAGDMYAAGKWKIGIRHPDRPSTGDEICEVTLKDRAVSTSGQYERINHIIDPANDKPARSFKSATVIAPRAIISDAIAKGYFIHGRIRTDLHPELAKETSAILITPQNELEFVGAVSARCRGRSI